MRESVEIRRVDSREEMDERSLTQRFIDAMGGLSGIPERGDYSLGTVMLQAIEKFSAMRAVQDELQSSLAAMRQRAEEAGKEASEWKELSAERAFQNEGMEEERDIAIARAERAEALLRSYQKDHMSWTSRTWRAEACLRRVQRLADDGVDDPAGPHNVLAQIANTVDAALSTVPPADASAMGGDRCDNCQHNPETCDRAECPAWGKSEEEKARILTNEANRPLNDEEHVIVDAGYERGKMILASVRAEEQKRRLERLVEGAYKEGLWDGIREMNEAYNGHCEPNEKTLWERSDARAVLAEMEQKS